MRVSSRLARAVAILALLGALVPVAMAQAGTLKRVRYRGATVTVPASWPVFDLARSPGTCVRFDRHAVYLGRPGPLQRCPAHLVGRSEALLLEPSVASAASAAGAGLNGAPGSENAARMRLGHHVVLTGTWNREPQLIRRALSGRALLPLPVPRPRPVAAATRAGPPAAAHTTGLGFDACATPSTAAMLAWRASPYHSVGVYLGGVNEACAQPNLTPAWVRTQTAAGWHLIPTYVGLQAPGNTCGCAAITPGRAAAQGASAATDAIAGAQAVGIGRGNPIIYDMEAYGTGAGATRTVLTFLTAWTTALHAAGYLSGVYSSSGSGITGLVNAQGTSFLEPDEVWFAHWNDQHTTGDSYLPADLWSTHQRIHQYSGGHDVTYGGYTLNIDGDYLDGPAAPVSPLPFRDGTFVAVSGTGAIYTIAGGAPIPVSTWAAFGARQPVRAITPGQFNQLNPVPTDGTFLITTAGRIYRVAGGSALPVSSWNLFGGHQTAVTVDPWAIVNSGTAISHLNAAPAPGTVVKGLPSGNVWQFVSGGRAAGSSVGSPGSGGAGAGPQTALSSSPATAVDDSALSAFPVVKLIPLCAVPQLHGLTLARATRVLTGAHCHLGRVSRPRKLSHSGPRVNRQYPSAGRRQPAGYPIALTLG